HLRHFESDLQVSYRIYLYRDCYLNDSLAFSEQQNSELLRDCRMLQVAFLIGLSVFPNLLYLDAPGEVKPLAVLQAQAFQEYLLLLFHSSPLSSQFQRTLSDYWST